MKPDFYNTISLRFNFKKKLIPVFAARLLPLLTLVIISILYSRKLSYEEYGTFQTFWIYSNILNIIVTFALPSMILANRDVVFNYFFKQFKIKINLFYLLLFIAVATLFYFTTPSFSATVRIFILIFILLQFVTTFADTLLIKRNQLTLYLTANIIYSVIFFGIHLYFYFTFFDLQSLILWLCCLLVVKAMLVFFIKKAIPDSYHSGSYKIFFKNWLYLGTNEIVGVIARWLDKVYVVFLLSAANFAVFVNGTIEIPLFAVLISAAETFMLTKISQTISDKRNTAFVFKESFKLLSYISFPVFFMLLVAHKEAFSVIFNDKYNQSVPIFLISIFIFPLRINHYTVILQCYNQTNKILIGSVIDIILALLLMTLLYPAMGVAGVALSIVISTYVQVFYYLWESAKLINTRIIDLVPVSFLSKLFFGLAVLYSCFFILKYYFLPFVFLLLSILITMAVIFFFLNNYFFSKTSSSKESKHGI